jgi:hypothetical protein
MSSGPKFLLVRFYIAAIAGRALVLPSVAEENNNASLHFVHAGGVELVKELPAPLKPDSKDQKRDMAIGLAQQSLRTPASIALALADSDRSAFQFGAFLGPSFTSDRLSVAARFFQQVG